MVSAQILSALLPSDNFSSDALFIVSFLGMFFFQNESIRVDERSEDSYFYRSWCFFVIFFQESLHFSNN